MYLDGMVLNKIDEVTSKYKSELYPNVRVLACFNEASVKLLYEAVKRDIIKVVRLKLYSLGHE